MGISFLRPFLHSLCCNSPWSYAVFWKLEHQHDMILVWEDGFFDNSKPIYPMEKQIEGFNFGNSNMIHPSGVSSSMLVETSGDHPVGFAAAEMSSASHVIGKGIIGEVAFTGTARWVYLDNIAANTFDSVLFPEYPNELLLQSVIGMKTILLLPVIPHGVLELGSMEMVAEDGALISYIKDKFESLDKPDGCDWRYPFQQFSLLSTFTDNLEEPSTVTTETVLEDQDATHTIKMKDCVLVAEHMTPVSIGQNFCDKSMKHCPGTFNVSHSEFNQDTSGLYHVSEPSYQLSYEDCKSLLAEDDNMNYIQSEDILIASPFADDFERKIYENFMNELMDFRFDDGAAKPDLVSGEFDSSICGTRSNLFSFPGDCELHKVMKGDSYECTYGTAISSQALNYCSNGNTEPTYGVDVLEIESNGHLMKEVEVEHPLEVVTNSCNSFNTSSPNNSDLTSSSMPSKKPLMSSKRYRQSECSTLVKQDMSSWNFLTSGHTAHRINSGLNLSPVGSSVESKASALPEKQLPRKGSDSLKVGKLSRLSSTGKRRSRGVQNQRPRPRDRQLIQDRLKDLRELVPNSEKCSIDGLLDQTVKHMLFLRSITDQADKLRNHDIKEETDEKTRITDEVNSSHKNGTSWAVELGSEQKLCPIVVKDLDQPGHMLIEMQCGDHGRFLQIADVIHRSQLTILKGVMEKGTTDVNNSLARFVVETSGSFHRLDIFWPLMKLLQQNQPPSISGKI